MKHLITFSILFFILYGCKKTNPRTVSKTTKITLADSIKSLNKKEITSKKKKITLLDSLKSICKKNTIEVFDIEKLKTDDFSQMIPINKTLFEHIYPNRDDFSENSFFIYSYLPSNNKDYLSLIVYQKNHEGENYRVDYIDLINIDSIGTQLDKIRLTAKDNQVVTYEVVSILKNNLLSITEKVSSEFDNDMDTLYVNKYTLKLNNKKRIDTIDVKRNFKVRKY